MASKLNVESLLRKQLGKEAGDKVLKRIDKMVKEGASPAAIEKVVMADLTAYVEKAVVSAVSVAVKPVSIKPISVKPITVSVKPAIKPIVVSPKINTGVSVKVGPPSFTKGSK